MTNLLKISESYSDSEGQETIIEKGEEKYKVVTIKPFTGECTTTVYEWVKYGYQILPSIFPDMPKPTRDNQHEIVVNWLKEYLEKDLPKPSYLEERIDTDNYSIRLGNLELKSCNKDFSNEYPHTRAVIVSYDKYGETKLAYWVNNFTLMFKGGRPFSNNVCSQTFMFLAKIGQELIENLETEEN